MFCEARPDLSSSHFHIFIYLRFIFMRKLNVSDDAENDLFINKMVLIISHIDSFNEEVTVFDLF